MGPSELPGLAVGQTGHVPRFGLGERALFFSSRGIFICSAGATRVGGSHSGDIESQQEDSTSKEASY